jgi:tRNA (cmo5U34)-methyltransferase
MIRDLFDKAAQNYDRARRQLVPCFDDFYSTVLDLIPCERDAACRIWILEPVQAFSRPLLHRRFRARISPSSTSRTPC